MRNVIINLINRVIIPKYGPIRFNVVHTNDLHAPGLGYEVTYSLDEKLSKKISEGIITDTKMLLQMIGMFDIAGLHTSEYIWVSGLEDTK